ncbi:MAG: CDP-alcohol phosphatidyltransferase family protein [Planctomycetota bacterium]
MALQAWLRIQAAVWLPGLAAVAWFDAQHWPWPWVAVALTAMAASFATLVWVLRARRSVADIATMVRFLGLLAVVGVGSQRFDVWLWAAALVVVLLDAVDGALARRFGSSEEGAVLDMEADQMTVLGLAVLVVHSGGAAHVLVLPALRYVFVLAMWWLGAPAHDPKPVNGDNRRGRRVCATVLAALLIALWPGIDALARDVVTAAAVLLLAWSFGDDARFLLTHRRAKARA